MTKRRRTNTGIPGVSFSWKRALGITRARQRFARKTGIPTTRSGWQRKAGRMMGVGRAPGCGCVAAVAALTISLLSGAMVLVLGVR
jgi:hypothetical protein